MNCENFYDWQKNERKVYFSKKIKSISNLFRSALIQYVYMLIND
jgi:hypothetical protein